VTLSDWIDDLVEELSGHREAILLAHSFAGYVAAGAMKRAAAHLRSVIFLDAVIPRPGASWFESMGPETEQYMRSIARDGATPWFSRPQLDQMYPDNQLTDADLSWMQAHVTAQPIGTFTQPADDQPLETRAKGIRLHYVKCLRTNPPAASISDGAPGWTMSSIDSSHWPMVTAPEDTAKLIVDVAESR
jgi:pimeloyl-ACP methyl ester carboxylesterase